MMIRNDFGEKKCLVKNFFFFKKNILSKIFFFEFPKFFSVEIFHMMSRLRMQSFMIIGGGVPEISVRTHTQIILVI